jgi:hypothetical protein
LKILESSVANPGLIGDAFLVKVCEASLLNANNSKGKQSSEKFEKSVERKKPPMILIHTL